MGRQLFHSTEAVWEMLARKKWLGCRHDSSPMVDILGSTPMWAQYIYFWLFNIKTYMYYILKIYMYYEKDIGGPWRCPGPTMFMKCFRSSMMFSLKKKKIHRFTIISFKKKLIHVLVLYFAGMILFNNILNLSVTFMIDFYSISILHWAYNLLTLSLLSFFKLGTILLYRAVVVKTCFSFHHSLVR